MNIRTASDLGRIIRSRRRDLGIDQAELAQKVGVSRQWLIDVEKGKPRAQVELILRTLRALGIQLWAETPGDDPSKSPVDINAVVDRARKPTTDGA